MISLAGRRSGAPRLFGAALACVAANSVAARANAQQCTTTRAIVAPAAYAGARIRSVRIEAAGPDAGTSRSVLRHLHRVTLPARIEQELLFAAGDTVDTLRVAESMRRLRALGFLDQAELAVTRCGAGDVDLVVATRDSWSATPEIRVRSSAATLGVNERNALGTGVGVRLALQSGSGGIGVQTAARLPGLPFHGLTSEVGAVAFANGHTWYGAFDTRAPVAGPAWTLSARMAASEREPRTQPGSQLDRATTSLLVGRRIGGGFGGAATYALGGAERQHADLAASAGDVVLGPRAVRRDYAGAMAGVARVATRFDTLTWILPRGGVADVPRGTEHEIVAGLGRDRVTGALATHWDGWAGRVLDAPRRGTLVVGDVWASGYDGDDLLRSSTVRAAVALRQRAWRGAWAATLAAESLRNPDPDVRALASLDPLSGALPRTTRLAESALSTSVERGVHLHDVTRSLGIDGALFAAGSYRWDPAGTTSEALGLAAVGVGLRLAPVRTPRATLRLDLGMPVAHVGAARGRPYIALSLAPWLLDGRQRDGRRLP